MSSIKIEHGIPMPPSRASLDDARVLELIGENPGMSNVEIAKALGWIQPNRGRAREAIKRLRKKGQLR